MTGMTGISESNVGMFNTFIFGEAIDWDFQTKPVKDRPIPSSYIHRDHVIYAVRHPNKALVISYGDATFSVLGARPYYGDTDVVKE